MSGLTSPFRIFGWFAAIVVAQAVFLPRHVQGEPDQGGARLSQESITVDADYSREWKSDDETVALLRGRCRIVQGTITLRSQKMVIWRSTIRSGREKRDRLSVFLEGDVRVDRPGNSRSSSSLLLHLETPNGVRYDVRHRLDAVDATVDPLYSRAEARRRSATRNGLLQTQYVQSATSTEQPEFDTIAFQPPAESLRRIRIFPRSAVPYNARSSESTQTTPPEQVWILSGGVNVLVEGVAVPFQDEAVPVGAVSLLADRMVIWTRARGNSGFQPETVQSRDEPLTVYLEGNIVIRQGQTTIRASRAVYDAREDRALLLNAELKSFVPQLQDNVRVRAERLRQLSRDSFHAQNAWTTTSRFGKPGYRLEASDIFFENRYTTPWIGPGVQAIDPATGAPVVESNPWITSLNNTLRIEDFPVFFLPYLSMPAKDPQIPLRRATFGHDRIFGGQLRTVWDMFQLTGMEEPPGTRWDLLADVFTSRGPGVGTAGEYTGSDMYGIAGTYVGEGLLYYIHDDGEDDLGRDRRNLAPEKKNRWRAQLRHRHDLPNNITLFGEIGVLSDRNFLNQYYEDEFDEEKDVESLLYAKQAFDNWAWTLFGRGQANDFTTTTEWYPRGDLYGLSEPLLGGRLTWSSHTSAGYAHLAPGEPPTLGTEVFTPLPFVADSKGGVLMTRHELNAPFGFGPLRVVPYAMGEAAHWGEDFNRDELDRIVGSAGIRSSLMLWRVFPYVRSRVFNLNGLAHKMLFEADYAWTDSSENLSDIPQYNEFDDNAQERFRERLVTNTFGGVLPAAFEPRFYAVRTGAGHSVTDPYHELIDDQQVARLAWRHRLQTKVGPPERLRIRDWMTLDLQASYFPKADRDNFGEDIGLLGAQYRWYVGERTRLLANAYYDLFDDAQQLWNVGVLSQRSRRGSIYVGMRQVRGAGLDSRILSASYTYKMGPKWASTFGTAYDFGENRNRGQSLTLTRIGSDFLVHVGLNFDESKDNAGIAIAVEPRLGALLNSSTQLGSLLGTNGP